MEIETLLKKWFSSCFGKKTASWTLRKGKKKQASVFCFVFLLSGPFYLFLSSAFFPFLTVLLSETWSQRKCACLKKISREKDIWFNCLKLLIRMLLRGKKRSGRYRLFRCYICLGFLCSESVTFSRAWWQRWGRGVISSVVTGQCSSNGSSLVHDGYWVGEKKLYIPLLQSFKCKFFR